MYKDLLKDDGTEEDILEEEDDSDEDVVYGKDDSDSDEGEEVFLKTNGSISLFSGSTVTYAAYIFN